METIVEKKQKNIITYSCNDRCNITCCDGGEIHCVKCCGPTNDNMLAYANTITPQPRKERRIINCQNKDCNIHTPNDVCMNCLMAKYQKDLDTAKKFSNLSVYECNSG